MSLVILWLRAIWLGWWERLFERLSGPTVVIERREPPRGYSFETEWAQGHPTGQRVRRRG